jgi:cysteine-rich repeat protein
MRVGVLFPLVLVLMGVELPDAAVAGGAYHACLYDCLHPRNCLRDVRQALREARQECANAGDPRQCRRAESRRARSSLRACRASRGDCEQCCGDCLDSLLAGGNTCPGFGFVGFGGCPNVCGDGRTKGAEICDDGNANDGDGCSSDCGVGG